MTELCLSSPEDQPPQLSFTLKQESDIQISKKLWTDVGRPIDILLVTAEGCEFVSCFHFLDQPFKSYIYEIGYMYFGRIGGANGKEKLKVALMNCSIGFATPLVQSAIGVLQPKAVVSVGICTSLISGKVRMGDVVIPSKLIFADGYSIPVSQRFSGLARDAPYGWVAPLKNRGELEVKVHCDCDILSQSLSDKHRYDDISEQYPRAVASETEGKGILSIKITLGYLPLRLLGELLVISQCHKKITRVNTKYK